MVEVVFRILSVLLLAFFALLIVFISGVRIVIELIDVKWKERWIRVGRPDDVDTIKEFQAKYSLFYPKHPWRDFFRHPWQAIVRH